MKRIRIKKQGGKTVIGGEAVIRNIQNLDDGEYAIEITKWKDQRRLRANNLYWKWVTIIGKELGYYKNEMHEAFLEAFSPTITTRKLDGKPKQQPMRSKDMSVEQFSEYMNQVEQFAVEHSIKLPRPEEA